jgi:hypothetical protein
MEDANIYRKDMKEIHGRQNKNQYEKDRINTSQNR